MSNSPVVSIIIPTLNEAAGLGHLLTYIAAHVGENVTYEVVVCDGGSQDGTVAQARHHHARVVQATRPGRPGQLNLGAAQAAGEILYFLHADTLPPPAFGQLITHYYQQGYPSGCFRLQFDHGHWILRLSSWASRFNTRNFQFGDQSLYIQKALFQQLGGFDEQLLLMEDVEMVTRIKRRHRFVLMPQRVVTSARKYLDHGVVRTEMTHLAVLLLYVGGLRQARLARVYKRLLRKH
ncbi:TIGR04283 family arsenosugar biosynthesis glycosyltransferase [Hymenobacter lucidus]|uniref:TIGR04283 family arsenosugar biosynthesis glycosyltransferase n=1 Tax=Hymenobacter lucidus TaxID=2880930 RepID=A0ABS8AP97_9BACT|nr:TIGR04283 family arsenosugar biosynthesis glycosyltransferase [Hymenobacter lucidus]MCB2408030.1 TIGR04283 family arsenosugar biosynthesis glycosyltransferase [Hymenobacter lucidus]